MIDWKAIGGATGLFIVLFAYTLAYEPDAVLLLLGLPCGFVAGYRAGGLSEGSVNGLAFGFGIGFLSFIAASYLAMRGPATPGVGLSIVFMFLVGIFLTVQSMVAGAVGGMVSSHVQ